MIGLFDITNGYLCSTDCQYVQGSLANSLTVEGGNEPQRTTVEYVCKTVVNQSNTTTNISPGDPYTWVPVWRHGVGATVGNSATTGAQIYVDNQGITFTIEAVDLGNLG
jgi:hypothetical protein